MEKMLNRGGGWVNTVKKKKAKKGKRREKCVRRRQYHQICFSSWSQAVNQSRTYILSQCVRLEDLLADESQAFEFLKTVYDKGLVQRCLYCVSETHEFFFSFFRFLYPRLNPQTGFKSPFTLSLASTHPRPTVWYATRRRTRAAYATTAAEQRVGSRERRKISAPLQRPSLV